MNIKKIFIVAGFVAFVLGAGFGLYWVFFRSAPAGPGAGNGFNAGVIPGIGSGNLTVVDNSLNTVNGLPWQQFIDEEVSPVATGGLTEVQSLTESTVKGSVTGLNGLQYYDADAQQFFVLGEDGQPRLLSDKKFFQVENITWSGAGDKAILEYPDGSNIVYNFKTGKQITLPREMEDFSFNKTGSQITAKWIGDNEDNNWLVASTDEGTGMFLIEPLGNQAHNTQMNFSPDNQIAAFYRSYVDGQRQEIFPIGLKGENFKSFVVNGAGFESKWSPEGDALLYSIYSDSTDYTPNLWVTQGRTSELGDLKVSLNVGTWPDKCTFASNTKLYCAVPQGLPRGAGLYPEIADDYPDNFYSIDLNSGIKSLLASPVGELGSYSATNLTLSPDGTVLYFTDRNTGRLQSIRLK